VPSAQHAEAVATTVGRLHQLTGRRLLLAAPPSGANLAAYAAWRRLRGADGAVPFLADRLQGLHALTLRPGGTCLTAQRVPAQLAVRPLESACQCLLWVSVRRCRHTVM
jgi:hypothetical protein